MGLQAQINNFGQTPPQLMMQPHPQVSDAHSIDSRMHAQARPSAVPLASESTKSFTYMRTSESRSSGAGRRSVAATDSLLPYFPPRRGSSRTLTLAMAPAIALPRLPMALTLKWRHTWSRS
eukprot:6207057-Pleurochrysis_carterae.AAC.2